MTICEALATAMRFYKDGRLEAAERLYQRILEGESQNPEALLLLGVISGQRGNQQAAIDYISRAIAASPQHAKAHYNLGVAFKDQGRLDEAAACWRRALELKRDDVEAQNNLANALREQGELDESVAGWRRAIESNPAFAEAHFNLGNALRDQRRPDEAVSSYRRALDLRPGFTAAQANLAFLLRQRESSRISPKIFVVGFPKAGTSSIHASLESAGIKSAHWAWYDLPPEREHLAHLVRLRRPAAFLGLLIKRAKSEGLPLLHYLERFSAFTQLDISLTQEMCYWPQIVDVPSLDAQYPGSKFILNVRPVHKWLNSVIRWRDLRARLAALDIPGLPNGVGYRDDELVAWYEWHNANMVNYFKGRDNFMVFDIENDDPRKLGEFLGIKDYVLEHRNQNKRKPNNA